MNDDQTTIAELRALMQRFVDQRDWRRFHTPKNLASCIAIETAELMEHFQWLTPEESHKVREHEETRTEIEHEMADVFAYLLALANVLDVDLASALEQKMQLNAQKYPAP